MEFKLLDNIREIDEQSWNNLAGKAYPFLNWHFLNALESSGCVSAKTGWHPQHVLIYENNKLIALMPMYLKSHSKGEYVFDHAWSSAYYRNGLQYFPKLLTAVPFTPCEGPRICFSNEVEAHQIILNLIIELIEELCEQHDISSWHLLFPEPESIKQFEHPLLLKREGVQFQWFNKSYESFEDFLLTFTSKKRKNLKRERRRIAEQEIKIERLIGSQIQSFHWEAFFEFYQATYWKRGMPEYLNLDFFKQLANSMPAQLLMVVAKIENADGENLVAAALSLIGEDTLYGRYWGCLEEFDNLHFELCYYQGIEFCIENNLKCFNSGAQGEHKISRGFAPVLTYSFHYVAHTEFRIAIGNFLQEEQKYNEHYQLVAQTELPYNIYHKE